MEQPIQYPTDEEIKIAAAAFAKIIDPPNRTKFLEDFEMGAKWCRFKFRYLIEQQPINLTPLTKPQKVSK